MCVPQGVHTMNTHTDPLLVTSVGFSMTPQRLEKQTLSEEIKSNYRSQPLTI